MTIKKIVRPVGVLGVGAVISILFAIASLMSTWTEGAYSFWIYAALCFIVLEGLSQILIRQPPVKWAKQSEISDNDSPLIPLNLLSFVLPPVGLISWLKLDHKFPRKARSAGRSAVRGVMVALIAVWVWYSYTQVNLAIKAIEYAQLTPIHPELAARSVRQKELPQKQKPHKAVQTENG